jgi:hypothetical protein
MVMVKHLVNIMPFQVKLIPSLECQSRLLVAYNIPTTSGTRQIDYIIFYTFGEPSIFRGATHLESNPTKV